MLIILTVICGALLIIILGQRRRNTGEGKPLQFFKYPRWKNLNYAHAKESALTGKIPKVFHPETGYYSGRILRGVVIADFELLKEAFAKKELCSRFGKQSVRELESASRRVSDKVF